MNDAPRDQSVRNAWINALRAETLRVGTLEIARVAHVGIWLATYADADGGSAFPSGETLAVLAGCTTESVTRAIRVLVAVGLLSRKRRPNASTLYHLLMPARQPDWGAHMHLYSETRQRRARRAAKEALAQKLAQARNASEDGFRTASPDWVPDSVLGGGSGMRPGTGSGVPDSVLGRGRNASGDGVRTASPAGGTSTDLPAVGTRSTDQNMAGLSPQPQVGRAQPPENDLSPPEPVPAQAAPAFARCSGCGHPYVPRPGRDTCNHCRKNATRSIQSPLLFGVPSEHDSPPGQPQPAADEDRHTDTA